jgi:serine/threonine protein kinase
MPTVPPPRGPGPAKPGGSSPYSGRVVARCRVGEKLGRGATSHVFRAHYEPLSKDIALKILGKDSAGAEDLRARFLSEARSVAKISHENIVKVLDVVEDHGLLCILMELVEGPTLQDRLDDEGVIKPRQAFRIAAQIARALEAAHAEKIVHRDVKPANVMLVGPAGDETVKVVDFGLAVQQEMNRVGTPLFMSPEAAQGKRIDEKSDVYALGICLYRMLTGVLPFTGATVKEILAAQNSCRRRSSASNSARRTTNCSRSCSSSPRATDRPPARRPNSSRTSPTTSKSARWACVASGAGRSASRRRGARRRAPDSGRGSRSRRSSWSE